LDPERDYVIRRIQTVSFEQLTIHYRRHDAWGWVPDSWVITQPNGSLRGTIKVEVLDIQINAPKPGELFDIQFLPGCEVIDERTNPLKIFRVQPDGSMREVSRTTGQLLPLPVVQPIDPWYWRYRWLLGGFGVLCAGLVWQYAVRRKRRLAE
jgi:hypothetical protein